MGRLVTYRSAGLLVVIAVLAAASACGGAASGRDLVFISNRDGNNEIYVMAADGSRQTALTNHDSDDAEAVWSPDGSRIAFTSNRDGARQIYVMNVDGSEQTPVTQRLSPQLEPALVLPMVPGLPSCPSETNNPDIYVANTDGTNLIRLANPDSDEQHPRWSPDGTRLAFESMVPATCCRHRSGERRRLWTGKLDQHG